MSSGGKENSGELSSSQVMKQVEGLSASFLHYLAAQRFIEAHLIPKGRRTVFNFPGSVVDDVRFFWEQNKLGVKPASAGRNRIEQPGVSGFIIGFDEANTPWNYKLGLQEDPAVAGFSLLYGGKPALLVETNHRLAAEAHEWQDRMHSFGLIPSEEIGITEAGKRIVTEPQGNLYSFYAHIFMQVGRADRDLVVDQLKAMQDRKPEGVISLRAQTLNSRRWNFIVGMEVSSLEALELWNRNDPSLSSSIQRARVLMARRHYPDSGVSGTNNSVKETMGVAPTIIRLAPVPGIPSSYLQACMEELREWDSGLKSVTVLTTGAGELVLEVNPSSATDQDVVFGRIHNHLERYVQGVKVYHVVPSADSRGFFDSDVPRAYSFINTSRPGQNHRAEKDIAQLGDPKTIRTYRVLGQRDADIIAAIRLDPGDSGRVARVQEEIRMRPLVEAVNTFL